MNYIISNASRAVVTCKKGLLYLIYFSIAALVLPSWTVAVSAIEDRSILVWGAKNSQGKYAIHLSSLQGGKWFEANVLSSGDGQNILPAVGSDGHGNIWVAWTELQGVQGSIWYSLFSGDKWSVAARLKTPTSSDIAPSLAVDDHGNGWLVYSGNDGGQDDIYSVHWSGEGWSEPVMVNRDDDFPDILPEIVIDKDGVAVVSWQGYNGDQYVTSFSRWDGSGWSPEQELLSDEKLSETIQQRSLLSVKEKKLLLPDLPDFITDTSQAVLYHRGKGRGKTIKLKGKR